VSVYRNVNSETA